jgi:hypothetical protein
VIHLDLRQIAKALIELPGNCVVCARKVALAETLPVFIQMSCISDEGTKWAQKGHIILRLMRFTRTYAAAEAL